MAVTLKLLIAFFVLYVAFKVFLFWRLNLALKKMEAKQQALKNLPSFDATRKSQTVSGQSGPGGTGASPLSEL